MNKEIFKKLYKKYQPKSIQIMLLVSFSIAAFVSMITLTIVLYSNFENRSRNVSVATGTWMLENTEDDLNRFLDNMRQVSSSLFLSVQQQTEIDSEKLLNEFSLLYRATQNDVISIALFEANGNLITASPYDKLKEDSDVTKQDWYINTIKNPGKILFSTPHVENLFSYSNDNFSWVVSLSRTVIFTKGGQTRHGVLLVDIDYASVCRIMTGINDTGLNQYAYLCDSDGNIFYHPENMEIALRKYNEVTAGAGKNAAGNYVQNIDGNTYNITVSDIDYTGWKIVSVIPYIRLAGSSSYVRYFVILILLMILLAILIMNKVIAARIARPIRMLTTSIKNGTVTDTSVPRIYIGGSSEVRYLGNTLQKLLDQISVLMHSILIEQEEKRKSELDVLQSQINPHFLYNTLDSIVWMVESGQNKEASFMITQLASLFRISLSEGRTIIRVEEEMRHAISYSNIQKARFKNSFTIDYDISDEIKDALCVKLIVQPILENAIYYGVKGMEEEGHIDVRAYKDNDDMYIEVEDNGYGIPDDILENILTETGRKSARGSGVGLINVDSRIKIRFGKKYGLIVTSELDEGTCVKIHLPYIPYTEENQKKYEKIITE
ncbi:MAG: sensor histidine kinase [Butyrivibrio sp.]|nr:sensor histidine kinase [Butyrivibrio sp.]